MRKLLHFNISKLPKFIPFILLLLFFLCENMMPQALAMTMQEIQGKENSAPTGFSLESAYPNPFNGYIIIPFTVIVEGEYRLEIRNVLGEKVKELTRMVYLPGKYSIGWNATDENNNQVPSGIYFARLSSTEEKAKIQKLIYLK